MSKAPGDQVKFGAKVEPVDCDTDEEVTYQLVGEYEADISAGLLYFSAARAMIEKAVGDIAEASHQAAIKITKLSRFRTSDWFLNRTLVDEEPPPISATKRRLPRCSTSP